MVMLGTKQGICRVLCVIVVGGGQGEWAGMPVSGVGHIEGL